MMIGISNETYEITLFPPWSYIKSTITQIPSILSKSIVRIQNFHFASPISDLPQAGDHWSKKRLKTSWTSPINLFLPSSTGLRRSLDRSCVYFTAKLSDMMCR